MIGKTPKIVPMCDAIKENGQPCGNRAAWSVRYLTPDDPGVMRRRIVVRRCYWHSELETAYPKGASQITVLGSWDAVTLEPRSSPSNGALK
jgi:hypothetical protein